MQISNVFANNNRVVVSASVRSTQVILIGSCIILLIVWVLLSSFIWLNEWIFLEIMITALTFILLGFLTVRVVTPPLPQKLRHFLTLWIIIKTVLSTIYFHYAFINSDGSLTTIYEYGDSFYHHLVAMSYFQYWSDGNIFGNPAFLSSQVEQWGYDYFLGLLYYITGPIPETGIIVNSYLFLVFCILGYKLFIIAGLTKKDASTGLIILSFFPGLWAWSSYLYKDSLLFVLVLASVLGVFNIVKQFRIQWLFLLIVLQFPLLALRYSYAFTIIIIFTIGILYAKKISTPKRIVTILCYCLFLFLVINFTMERNFYKYGILDAPEYTRHVLGLETSGGRFMTEGLGKSLNMTNFFYVLPAKAIYILVAPFPWFTKWGGAEQIDYVLSHIDAIYYISLLVSIVLVFLEKRKILVTKEQRLLLLTGIAFFLIPLFMFFPARRYISVCIPFFMAYALPACLEKQRFAKSIFISIGIIIVMHLHYFLF